MMPSRQARLIEESAVVRWKMRGKKPNYVSLSSLWLEKDLRRDFFFCSVSRRPLVATPMDVQSGPPIAVWATHLHDVREHSHNM